MSLTNKSIKKVELTILIIIFSATIFCIPKYVEENYVYIVKPVKSISPFYGSCHSYECDGFSKDEIIYDSKIINMFESQYLSQNGKEQVLVKYVLDLIETQRKEIISSKYTKKHSQPSSKIIESETNYFVLKSEKNEDNLDHESSEDRLQIEKVNNLANSINYIFIVFIILSCLIVMYIHKAKNDKWITMSDLFLVVISVTTCFTSGNHLLSTVPKFLEIMPTFDAAIFALGPVSVIWLAIKGIFDLLIPIAKSTK